jgi:hypothetical protein
MRWKGQDGARSHEQEFKRKSPSHPNPQPSTLLDCAGSLDSALVTLHSSRLSRGVQTQQPSHNFIESNTYLVVKLLAHVFNLVLIHSNSSFQMLQLLFFQDLFPIFVVFNLLSAFLESSFQLQKTVIS